MENFKAIYRVVGVIAFISVVIWAVSSTNNTKILNIESNVKKEYSSIQQLPDATFLSVESSHKSNKALVDAKFKTDKNYDEIKKYYDDELKKLGWIFESEKSVKVWGKDLGGKIIRYTKGEYSLNVEYAGSMADYVWTYAIDVGWGYN